MINWYIQLSQLVLLGIIFGLLHTKPGSQVITWLNRQVVDPIGRLALRPGLAYGLLAGWTLLLLTGLSLIAWPNPIDHDELSYRLAGDTFAHGRLVNPMHPLWRFFETFHVVTNPFYASKYPPGQGLVLALGQLIGNQVIGIWIAYIGGILMVYYLLRAALPPGPALLTGLLVALHSSLIRQWGLAFWCGALFMLGGALALGAAIRLWHNPGRGRHVVALAAGVFILLISRPYEGGVYSLFPLSMLVLRAGKSINIGQSRVLMGWLPGLVLLVGLVSLIPLYNTLITGSPIRFPYAYYYERYEQARPFLVQTEAPRPAGYIRPEMRRYHDSETVIFRERKTLAGWLLGFMHKLDLYGTFYIGPLFLLPFAYGLLRRKTLPVRLAAGSVGLALLANLICTWEMPHYVGASTGAMAVVVGWGMLGLAQRPGRWHYRRQVLVAAICLTMLPVTIAESVIQTKRQSWQHVRWRQHHELALKAQGGQHVILVNYRPDHNLFREWIYNGADIDAQTVIWALDKGEKLNVPLLRYYPNRHIWRCRPDTAPDRLERVR